MITSRVTLDNNKNFINSPLKLIDSSSDSNSLIQINLSPSKIISNDNINDNSVILLSKSMFITPKKQLNNINNPTTPEMSQIEKQITFAPKKNPNKPKRIYPLLDKDNYLTYGLHKNLNPSPSSSCSSKLCHKYLPLKYKNDENYKLKLFKFIRPSKFFDTKTTTCKYAEYKRDSLKFDGNITKYENMLCIKKKHKFLTVGLELL